MNRTLIVPLACHAILSSGLIGNSRADETRSVTVKFAPGADSAKVSGHIAGRDSVLYKLNARDGQFLSVSLRSKSPSVGFNIYIPGRGPGDEELFSSEPGGRDYVGQLYKSGDHSVSVFLIRSAARQGKAADFDLTFRITAKPPAAETPTPGGSAFTKTVSYGDITFSVTSPQPEPSGDSRGQSATGNVQYMFVQNAKDVSFTDGKMTLKGVSGSTILFSDRPDRMAGHMTTADFAKNWNMGKDSFKIDNPNAALAIFGEKEPNDVVVELSNPVLENDSLTYDIKVLEGSIPKGSGECSLFIDLIGRPLTPVSYAGVARRTTRRVVRRY